MAQIVKMGIDRKPSQYPKFLRVRADINKFFEANIKTSDPWRAGELVRVAPYEEQVRNSEYDHLLKYPIGEHLSTPSHFRKYYVKVFRKGADGAWTDKRVTSWDKFEEIIMKS